MTRGVRLRALVAAFVDAGTMERVIDPAIADLQHEPFSFTQYLALLAVIAFCFVEHIMRIGTLRCSFCRRRDAQVSKLVAGPWRLLAGRVYICDRCAMQTIEIMEQSVDSPPRGQTASLFRRILSRFQWSRRDDGRSLSAIVTPTV
ncbi:MAG TPA: ClpX C4-type zinc finger protein [Vicinamibacterales bacterium]|nr:ClpX C4-type zinc finger protein [Vicinamibacterales bacterium]